MIHAVAAVDDLDPLDRSVEAEFDPVAQLVIDIAQHDVVYVGAEMTH